MQVSLPNRAVKSLDANSAAGAKGVVRACRFDVRLCMTDWSDVPDFYRLAMQLDYISNVITRATVIIVRSYLNPIADL